MNTIKKMNIPDFNKRILTSFAQMNKEAKFKYIVNKLEEEDLKNGIIHRPDYPLRIHKANRY